MARPQRTALQLAPVASLLALILLLVSGAMAQTPLAGTPIGNQASATYTDASNIVRTATSNIVITQVAQVASLLLTADNGRTASPGAQVIYSHTLTNTGNGSDTFTLTLATGGAVIHQNTAIYADANNDGIPDNSTNLVGTQVTVPAGGVFRFLVVGTVPVSATAGQTGTMTVTATSGFDNTQTKNNTDTTTVTSNAVVNVTKSISAPSGASPSGPYTVTLTYTNNGNATATGVTITDALPAGMTYVAGSGRWSVTGATVLTDATGDVQPAAGSPHIDYSVTGSTVTAIIDSIPATVSGTITFQINIAAGIPPSTLNNTATVAYNDGAANVGPFNTNVASFTVRQSAAVAISDTGTSATGDADNTVNGVQLIASAAQGATISFNNNVTNNGNGTDSFNITLSGSTFPAGTTFVLYKSDGVTPLTDTNGDGIPDTGPLAAGATYKVVVQATLPPAASGGGAYNVNVTATSTAVGVINAGANATMIDRLTTITASTVDVTNDAPVGQAGVKGNGGGPEGSAVVTNATNPGASTTFTLYINNTAGPADSYDLAASQSVPFPGSLPAGWTVVFRTSTGTDCSTLGASITNTGVINAGASKLVCAVVTVPANYAAGTVNLYFRALSQATNASDIIHDAVSVNTVHNVTLTPNSNGQVFPGGSVVYVHTLSNSGNVTETVTFTGSFVADSQSGFASILFRDNGSTPNTLDAGDTAVTTATTIVLNAGQSVVLLAKVTAPPAASIGAVDTTTLTATYNSGALTATATDTSTVIAGDLRLTKLQALDANCDGVADTAFSATTITSGAKPGACLVYQITGSNQGSAQVTSVVVSDATPANTTYFTAGGAHPATSTQGTVTAPAAGATGTISVSVGTLDPGASVVITFGVKINP
jgi:uncharacterized repeat protein (TIGR01451 family)